MGIGILSPVPAIIVNSALAACAAEGCATFGANLWELFAYIEETHGPGLPVLFYPVQTFGDPDRLCAPGFCNIRGVFRGTREPDSGKHHSFRRSPGVMVKDGVPNTSWTVFWEVCDLKLQAGTDRIAITSLVADGHRKGLPLGFVPPAPMLVRAAFL